ncbi:Golgi SNAP receptor complex member 1-2 [Dionaea muscipula]
MSLTFFLFQLQPRQAGEYQNQTTKKTGEEEIDLSLGRPSGHQLYRTSSKSGERAYWWLSSDSSGWPAWRICTVDPSMELQESGWEELRKEARKIEGDLDVKLSSYAKLGARFTQAGYVDNGSPTVGSSRSWKSMEMEIQSLLEKLLDVNDAMSRCAASAAPTTSVTQKLARHRDILHEFTQEFRRIKGNINSMREHAELLSSVRDEISEYKASGSMSPKMQILRERAAIHGSITHIDDVINQAQTTRAALGSQRALFGDIGGKVKILSEKFPIIRGLLGSIKRRRSRDTLILSAVIAACTLFLIIYWLSK